MDKITTPDTELIVMTTSKHNYCSSINCINTNIILRKLYQKLLFNSQIIQVSEQRMPHLLLQLYSDAEAATLRSLCTIFHSLEPYTSTSNTSATDYH